MKLLVCEDDDMTLKLLTHKLTYEGFTVEPAKNGKIAIEQLMAKEYDLIITDMLMPFNTGLEIINLVRNEQKKATPIIVLSKIGMEKTVIQAFDMGANDYVVKPFSPNELTSRIRILLRSNN